jgi:hypothetical protein
LSVVDDILREHLLMLFTIQTLTYFHYSEGVCIEDRTVWDETMTRALTSLPHLTSVSIPHTVLYEEAQMVLCACKTLTHLSFHYDRQDMFRLRPLPLSVQQQLKQNTSLLSFEFGACSNRDWEFEGEFVTPLLSRNRRLLHTWRRICVLLASYRANHFSPIRDSILSLMSDVMCFLV